MRIAIWHNLPTGGGKRALYNQIRGFLKRGHEVESWCPSTADQTYFPFGEIIPEHVMPLDWVSSEKESLWNRVVGSYRDVVSLLRAMDEHCQACAQQINDAGFDLLFVGACQFFRVTPIARSVRLPSILYLQEPYRWLYEALPQLPWLARPESPRMAPLSVYRSLKDLVRIQGLRIQAREEVKNARAYGQILVNSFFSRESVLRAYGLDARVCYLGIDTSTFVYDPRPREPFVVSLGSMTAEKNARFVIEAVSRLGEPRPPLVWIANAANTSYRREMEKLASSLNVRFEIRLRISDAELVDALNRAAMMLYAPRLEPFGMAPLEGNACGLPVIAVAEGGIRETIVDGINGLLVDADPEAMASAIRHLLDDDNHARALGEAGVRLINARWSLGAAEQRLEEHLERVVSSSRR
jgi:glycosyltransferase involved in cell wall biosynthesis